MLEEIEYYLNTFKKICSAITNEELEFIKQDISFQRFPKKHYYLKPGKVQTAMGFLSKGLIRNFYIDDLGKEITISFLSEGQYVTDYLAFIKQQKSKYYFQCIEDCVMINLPHATIQKGYDQYKNYERYGRLVAERILEIRMKRMESFLFESAEERYLNFIKQNPILNNRISVTHLATYLGIERQSLSRIRKKIAVR